MSPSKNAACPCNSGKKYKRCCGLADNDTKKQKVKLANLLAARNTMDLLQTIAGLTLWPLNHGKNIRLENISREAIIHCNNTSKKATQEELNKYLRQYFSVEPLEDPPINLFTEVIAFYGGDYIIFPGITESSGFVLNNLLPAIFNWPYASINEQFKNNCSHSAHLMLLLSDLASRKLGYGRYLNGKKDHEYISVPSHPELNRLKKAAFITNQEMEDLFSSHQIARQALAPFLSNINDPTFRDRHIEESPLLKKPLIATKDGYIIASPASISYSLTEFIKEHAIGFNCENELFTAYHGLVWNNLKMQLQSMGFKKLEIPDFEVSSNQHVNTIIAQFDDDKIAIIQYISIGLGAKPPSAQELAKQREELCGRIAEISQYAAFEFLDITIPSSIGDDIMFPIMGNTKSQTLSISSYDFDILSNSRECKALDLWKFALAREQQVPRLAKLAGLTFLDEYKIYKDHGDSFYLSDQGFDLSKWRYGNSQSFIQEAKLLNDEHSVSLNVNGRIAKTFVRRKDKYAPIYVSLMDLAANELQFEIEGFDVSIWVKPVMIDQPSAALRHLYWELTDTISYWLWQICNDIKERLKALHRPCIVFTFELGDPVRFENIDDRFIRDPEIYRKLIVASAADSIHAIIPDQIMAYFYGADNEGDRILVRQLLLGVNDLLTKNGLPPLSGIDIETIIKKNAPLGKKKKFIILHSRSNLLLDERNLKSYRYIQDYDVNVVESSIGPLLGTLLPPEGEIVNQEEKKKLVINIVLKALLPQLKKTISRYNNEDLIKRLISLNESLIQHREVQKIKTPTRIACFVGQEEHTVDLHDMLADINRTTIAVRCLLEHIAAEPPRGQKKVSKTAIDELIAIMDRIISWGSVGDQISYHLFDIRMGILKTGRIGTEKKVARKIFDPYHMSKVRETVQDAISSFEQEFPRDLTEAENEIPPNLDKAFVEEFKVAFTRICRFIDGLADIAFTQSTPYAVLDRKTLFSEINRRVEPFSNDEFNHVVDFLALVNRGDVMKRPKGYDGYDISPWRFNRRLSLLRKPLIICDTTDRKNPLIYWGARQVLVSRMTLAEQCMMDRLKVSDGSPVKKVLGRLSQRRGIDLVKSVLDKLELKGILLDSEVAIGPNGKLKTAVDIGDIDVLLIDFMNKIIYSLECKSFAPSRNIKEMIEECEKLLGSKSEKGLLSKHETRHQWLTANLNQVSVAYKRDLTAFTVKSAFITREDMLFPYLKEIGVSMPFITLYDLEAKGFDVLQKV